MFSQKFFDILKTNYEFDDPIMSDNKNGTELREPNIRGKALNRREPTTLSHNVTLLIEIGIVLVVLAVVGIVFYFSQRKRVNVHRRRWLDSDINVDNYSEGQIYDTNGILEECQPAEFDQNDCPPTYESVVQQSVVTSKKTSRKSAKRSRNSPSPQCQSNSRDEFQQYCIGTISIRNSEPLITSQSLDCIFTRSNENSLLIERRPLASASPRDENSCNGDESTKRRKCLKDDLNVDVNRLQNSQLVKTDDENETSEKLDIVPMKPVKYQNEIALLDASGLPSYDTALKIQECGNM